MRLFGKLRDFYHELDTLEKRSFWIHAPVSALIAVVSLFTAPGMFSSSLYMVGAGVCVVFPIGMMIVCYKTKDYHVCYPTFCIGIGAICIPLTFLSNGGFHSGMPLMCLTATVISAFIYDRKWRLVSFAISMISDLFVFWVSKTGFETLVKVNNDFIETDITICFVLSTIGLFVCINLLITEARHLMTNAEVLNKVMDESVRKSVIEKANKGVLSNEGVLTKVTVLFIDISRFTSTTEKMAPEMAAQYLNTFLEIADKCIHNNDGILDKFIGDCALAYWLDPDQNGKNVVSSIQTVMDVRKELYEKAEYVYQKFHTELDFSAGIDYGDVVIGSIGSANRRDFTIIGDAVNTANRLQGIAARGELLISRKVHELVKEKVSVTSIDENFYLRGKNSPMEIYRVNELLDKGYEDRNLSKVNELRREDQYLFHVCGSRGSFPVSGIRYSEFGGETSCYIIKKRKYAVVIDCGSGLGNAKGILEDCEKIDILLTHVHYDHIIGLLNMSVFPKSAKMTIYGHFGGWCGMNTIHDFLGAPYWPINLINVENVDVMVGLEYKLSEYITATFYKADHPNNGTVIKLDVNGKKVCIFADLEDPSYIDPKIAYKSDLLLYDGMYDDADCKKHEGWGHSTWQEATRYAEEEQVKRLVVTHHNPENADHALQYREDRAKDNFSRTIFARTGDVYTI